MRRAIVLVVVGCCCGKAPDPAPSPKTNDAGENPGTGDPTARPAVDEMDPVRRDAGRRVDASTPGAERGAAWVRAVLAGRDAAREPAVWLAPGKGADLYEGPSGVPLSVTRHIKYGTTSPKPVIDSGTSVASSRPSRYGRRPDLPLPVTPKGTPMLRILCEERSFVIAPWVFRSDTRETLPRAVDNHDGDWEGQVDTGRHAALVRGQLLVSPSSGTTLGVITTGAEFGCREDCSTEHPTVVLWACGRQLDLRAQPPAESR